MKNVLLKGMTWSDPRGFDPVVAAAKVYDGVAVHWDKRSLQDFESYPVDELAARYDLIIIDHPHVGAITAQNCLEPFDDWASSDQLARLSNESVGRSFESYHYQGKQWALPVDAATQVQAFRPDLQAQPLTSWQQVVKMAEDGRVAWAMRNPHILMHFFTLAANLGTPCSVSRGPLIEPGVGERVIDALLAVTRYLDTAFYEMDPIAILDLLAEEQTYAVSPFIYLYRGYASPAYRSHQVRFADIPCIGRSGPIGSVLGGTGIAVSAHCAHKQEAMAFALWLASAECQRTVYAEHSGQPGNALAWADEKVNAQAGNAYFDTRCTLEGSWVRPRHAGYMAFQEEGSEILANACRQSMTPTQATRQLNERFMASFEGV